MAGMGALQGRPHCCWQPPWRRRVAWKEPMAGEWDGHLGERADPAPALSGFGVSDPKATLPCPLFHCSSGPSLLTTVSCSLHG